MKLSECPWKAGIGDKTIPAPCSHPVNPRALFCPGNEGWEWKRRYRGVIFGWDCSRCGPVGPRHQGLITGRTVRPNTTTLLHCQGSLAGNYRLRARVSFCTVKKCLSTHCGMYFGVYCFYHHAQLLCTDKWRDLQAVKGSWMKPKRGFICFSSPRTSPSIPCICSSYTFCCMGLLTLYLHKIHMIIQKWFSFCKQTWKNNTNPMSNMWSPLYM